jgi:hypothetical protein
MRRYPLLALNHPGKTNHYMSWTIQRTCHLCVLKNTENLSLTDPEPSWTIPHLTILRILKISPLLLLNNAEELSLTGLDPSLETNSYLSWTIIRNIIGPETPEWLSLTCSESSWEPTVLYCTIYYTITYFPEQQWENIELNLRETFPLLILKNSEETFVDNLLPGWYSLSEKSGTLCVKFSREKYDNMLSW